MMFLKQHEMCTITKYISSAQIMQQHGSLATNDNLMKLNTI